MNQLVITALFAAATGLSLQGQTIDLKAEIPFDFQMGKKAMPAGEYSVHHAGNILILQKSSVPRAAAVTLTTRASRPKPPAKGVMEFNKYGDTYYLAEVWTPDSGSGAILFRTAREKELASRTNGIVQRAGISLQRK